MNLCSAQNVHKTEEEEEKHQDNVWHPFNLFVMVPWFPAYGVDYGEPPNARNQYIMADAVNTSSKLQFTALPPRN